MLRAEGSEMRFLYLCGALLVASACASAETSDGAAQGGSASGAASAGAQSGGASAGGAQSGGASAGGAQSGGASGGGLAGTGGSGEKQACGSDGLLCDPGALCVESTIYPNNVDPNHVYPPSTSWQCKTNPCGSEALSCDCARSACQYPECSVAANKLVCVFRAVCASPETLIATPSGQRRIDELRVGDLVYSADRAALRAVPLVRVSRTPVSGHRVIELRTADGATMEISAGHPTADGRYFGDLRPGDLLDGVVVSSSRVVDYRFAYTYDVLPASDTGTYVAFGKLIGSTLK